MRCDHPRSSPRRLLGRALPCWRGGVRFTYTVPSGSACAVSRQAWVCLLGAGAVMVVVGACMVVVVVVGAGSAVRVAGDYLPR
ncbi:uncharacterized protein K452DRAFT_27588 [Aplosporella prunicola CBS 121167]|uniref:Uncharacterized protein n=1 Tax=Aplosporella prunicola CBS 121167 TaxID=1176127 RepID=A0A6A6BD96_9PEZI|nr:uncharacterized protein K452DRAFT_27588 [Aplosporella prunicola CBS 121167]KAF2142162.1 hypothetical protein K452DRAFT_27588 [Aplosporella prunicola CBS 121167]